VIGCWFRRADIKAVIERPEIRGGPALYGALGWLLPVSLVGGALFILSSLSEDLVNTSVVFLFAMLAIVILFASIFSIVSQFSTEEHFRVGSVPKSLSFSEAIHFSIVTISTVGYGDIVPSSSIARLLASIEVICGVMLLLFGVSELIEYTREHRANRRAK
jgi:hypothetical protein